jgi:hypothetical protein
MLCDCDAALSKLTGDSDSTQRGIPGYGKASNRVQADDYSTHCPKAKPEPRVGQKTNPESAEEHSANDKAAEGYWSERNSTRRKKSSDGDIADCNPGLDRLAA